MAVLTLDGSANNFAWSSTASSTITLTTVNPNNLVVLVVSAETSDTTGVHAIVSSIAMTGGSGTISPFAQRSSSFLDNVPNSNPVGGPIGHNFEIWWAVATTPLTAAVFTVTLSKAIDDAVLDIFSVNYDSINAPVWTTNVSCPAIFSDVSGATTTPQATGVSTNNACMAIGFFASPRHPTLIETNGVGYTIIESSANHGGNNDQAQAEEYQVFSSAQSSLTIPFGTDTPVWFVIGDAIEPFTLPPPPQATTGGRQIDVDELYVANHDWHKRQLEYEYQKISNAATELGSLGGIARAKSLTAKHRTHIATVAAQARWQTNKNR